MNCSLKFKYKREGSCIIQQKVCKASFKGVDVNVGFVGYITCSNGLFVLMPFPPTKIQLSLKPKVLIIELPRSEIRCLASSLSLPKKKKKKKTDIISWPRVQPILQITKAIAVYHGDQNYMSKHGDVVVVQSPYFVDGSSNEAIITIVPSSISFRHLIKGATSAQD